MYRGSNLIIEILVFFRIMDNWGQFPIENKRKIHILIHKIMHGDCDVTIEVSIAFPPKKPFAWSRFWYENIEFYTVLPLLNYKNDAIHSFQSTACHFYFMYFKFIAKFISVVHICNNYLSKVWCKKTFIFGWKLY